jgi:hypothetical protein
MSTGRFVPRDIKLRPVAAGLATAGLALTLGACNPKLETMAETNNAETPAPVVAATAPATGEVPADLLEKIIDDLVAQESLARDAIEVERAESVIWSDGALGCPKSGEMYTHAQVPGYWVVLKSDEKRYDYRASEKGHFRRCSASFKVQLPVG